jgi:hypothetical protein
LSNVTNLSETPPEPGTQRLTRGQIGFYLAGYLVLVAGSIGSAWAYRLALANEARDAAVAGIFDTKANRYRLEVLGGKGNVLASDIQDWFMGLFEGKHLAYTLAVLTLLGAVVCFFIALHLPDFPPPHEEPPEARDKPAS